MKFSTTATIVATTLALAGSQAKPLFEADAVFDPEVESHGHVHASCIVECPNGDLRAVWYENGSPLQPPYFSEQQDKSDDVRIGGARKPKGVDAWEEPFVMADTFGASDNNPCMVVDGQQRLWLIYPTLTGVPKWTWASALLRYRVSSDYERPGRPTWDKVDVLIPHVEGLQDVLDETLQKVEKAGAISKEEMAQWREETAEAMKNPLVMRFGFMPRAHPLVRSDGTLIVPLSNENFDIPVMAMTGDGGETWTFSKPVPSAGLSQPTLVEFPDGKIVAFFRNGFPDKRVRRSESEDGGMTWSEVASTDLPHPNAGIEALLLRSGRLLMIYNDTEEDPRDKLAVSISADRGKTWKWTRHLEDTPDGRFDYPSVIQAKDGTLHATYSHNLKTVKHVHFNEEWVQDGD